jgi:hypothetical protein
MSSRERKIPGMWPQDERINQCASQIVAVSVSGGNVPKKTERSSIGLRLAAAFALRPFANCDWHFIGLRIGKFFV